MDHSSFADYIQPLLRICKMPERTLDYEAKKKKKDYYPHSPTEYLPLNSESQLT